MKGVLILYLLLLSVAITAQKTLAIDVFTLGHFKRLHISQNSSMTYKLKGSFHKQTSMIVDMQDSILYTETGETIRLNEIRKIIFDRSNFLTRMFSAAFRTAGIGYIVIDAFNNSINSEMPVFKERVLVAGSVLFLVGEVIHIANKKRITIGKNRTLKIIDLSPN